VFVTHFYLVSRFVVGCAFPGCVEGVDLLPVPRGGSGGFTKNRSPILNILTVSYSFCEIIDVEETKIRCICSWVR